MVARQLGQLRLLVAQSLQRHAALLHLEPRHLFRFLTSQRHFQGLSASLSLGAAQSLLFELNIPPDHSQLDCAVYVLMALLGWLLIGFEY